MTNDTHDVGLVSLFINGVAHRLAVDSETFVSFAIGFIKTSVPKLSWFPSSGLGTSFEGSFQTRSKVCFGPGVIHGTLTEEVPARNLVSASDAEVFLQGIDRVLFAGAAVAVIGAFTSLIKRPGIARKAWHAGLSRK
jgi:hypothetical protein